MDAQWSTEVSASDWWTARLEARHDGIGFLVPDGFEAMARIFHPVESSGPGPDPSVGTSTWAAVARRHRRIAHPEMQLHAISTPAGTRPDDHAHQAAYASWGELPQRERRELAAITAASCGSDACWFGVWDGYGHLHPTTARTTSYRSDATRVVQAVQRLLNRRRVRQPGVAPKHVRAAGRVSAPNRDYLLMRGSLSGIDDAAALAGGADETWPNRSQTPNLWWPDDQTWFVVTEIDFCWTYVCGSEQLIANVLQSSVLEALRADRSHQGHVGADLVNT